MNIQEARKIARYKTMGCWWTSRAFPKAQPNWSGIAGELIHLANEYGDAEAAEAGQVLGLVKTKLPN